MFESLESRQLLSTTTLAGETTVPSPTTQAPPSDTQPVARKAGAQQQEYFVVKLNEVYVTSYTIG